MIESAVLENLVTGYIIEFNTDKIPFRRFLTTVDMRSEDRERVNEDGLYPTNTLAGKRMFSCEGDLMDVTSAGYWETRMSIMRAIRRAPYRGNRVPYKLSLRFTGINEDIYSYCTLDGWPELPIEATYATRGDFQINFKAFDPVMYGSTLLSQTANTPSVSTGVSFPVAFPAVFGAGASGGDILLGNSGTESSWPSVVIYGPCTNPKLIRTESGDTVAFDGLVLKSGETVTLDFRTKRVVTNSGVNVYSMLTDDSTWWKVEPDPEMNTVRFAAFDSTSPCKAVFTWHNGYMI